MADTLPPESNRQAVQLDVDYALIARIVAQTIVQTKAPPLSNRAEQVSLRRRTDYQVTIDMIKLLTDIRFRCLMFVTAVTAIANALLSSTVRPEARIPFGFVGLLATLGISVYELRNSQLYESALHRAKKLEQLLGMDEAVENWNHGGLFSERPPYVRRDDWAKLSSAERDALSRDAKDRLAMRYWFVPVRHDYGLACIYGAALAGWGYLFVAGVLALAPPFGLWPALPPGWPPLVSLLIALAVFGVSVKIFCDHDRTRYKQNPPR